MKTQLRYISIFFTAFFFVLFCMAAAFLFALSKDYYQLAIAHNQTYIDSFNFGTDAVTKFGSENYASLEAYVASIKKAILIMSSVTLLLGAGVYVNFKKLMNPKKEVVKVNS